MASGQTRAQKRKAAGQVPPPNGRQSKFSPERLQRILFALRAGARRAVAASHGGVAPRTLELWLAEGRAQIADGDDGECAPSAVETHAQFARAVEDAEHHHELRLIAQIEKAAAVDWKAAAFLLTHGPSRAYFYKHEKMELAASAGEAPKIEIILTSEPEPKP